MEGRTPLCLDAYLSSPRHSMGISRRKLPRIRPVCLPAHDAQTFMRPALELFASDKCLGLVENLTEFYPAARWQSCVVHFYRNVWTAVPTEGEEMAVMLKAIHAQED